MSWSRAFKTALPFWIVTVSAVVALMLFTEFVTNVGKAEAIKRVILVAVVGLPLIASVVRATSNDTRRFRAAFPKKDDE